MPHGNYYLFALRLLVSYKFIHKSINRYVEKFRVGQIDGKVKKMKNPNDKGNHVTNSICEMEKSRVLKYETGDIKRSGRSDIL